MSRSPAPRKMLFIIGSGRCGSTMMQEVIARHPDAGFISNVDANVLKLNMKGRWNNAIYRHTPQAFTQRDRRFAKLGPLQFRFGPSEAYQMLNRRVSLIISETRRDLLAEDVTPSLEASFRRFFEERMKAQKKPLFLTKFAGWPRARFIHEVFPEARFLHVVRDGRAVAESLIRRPWWRGYQGPGAWQFGPLSEQHAKEWDAADRSFIVLAGLQWKILMDAFEDARGALPDEQWMQVRYEDFVAEPRGHLERILDFAGVEWTPKFEKGFLKYEFMPERKDAYRDNLTSEQASALDEVLADPLERLGYDVS